MSSLVSTSAQVRTGLLLGLHQHLFLVGSYAWCHGTCSGQIELSKPSRQVVPSRAVPQQDGKELRERVARSEGGLNQVRWWAAFVREAEEKHRKILELLLWRVTSVASGHPSIGSIWIDVPHMGLPACGICLYIP